MHKKTKPNTKSKKVSSAPKQPAVNIGYSIIHFADITDSTHRQSRAQLLSLLKQTNPDTNIQLKTFYLSVGKPVDNVTRRVINVLAKSYESGHDTKMVLIDESVAMYYEFIARLKYGAVVIYKGNYMRKENLINYSSKYIELEKMENVNPGYLPPSGVGESMQIVSSNIFELDLKSAIDQTATLHRFAPSMLLGMHQQISMRGKVSKLLKAIAEDTHTHWGKPVPDGINLPFKLTADDIELITQQESEHTLSGTLATTKRNAAGKDKSTLLNQF